MLTKTLHTVPLGSQVQGWQAWATAPRLFAFGDSVLLCVPGWPHTWFPSASAFHLGSFRDSAVWPWTHCNKGEASFRYWCLMLTEDGTQDHPQIAVPNYITQGFIKAILTRLESSCLRALRHTALWYRVYVLPTCSQGQTSLSAEAKPRGLLSYMNKISSKEPRKLSVLGQQGLPVRGIFAS